ncbi:hypothetical protein [Lachnotalea glycerini]|uniref:ATP-binding sugar transporter Gifsy-2 n=1 Tax=Lachnotalea glycerini TaxID=1763509 RepID=A0A371J7A3_9FIRM|nr:hypothetical protein [Lachnotalea glycerini]RDY28652.1 hypothetical protein CG710_019280 [Lachnotalea glycerini]
MSFKDIIKNDIQSIFFNPDEFGEEHVVDGKRMMIIIDNNEQIKREKRYHSMGEGLYLKQVLFYVSEAIFGELPKIGRQLILDEKSYIITDAINEDGIFSISLEAVNS